MDLSRVILAMAEAEGPTSVLRQVLAPLLEYEDVLLARVWFLDDRDCPVCSLARNMPPANALHLRASGTRPTATPAGDGIEGGCHLIRTGGASQIAAIALHGKPRLSTSVESLGDWGLEPTWPEAPAIRGVLGYPLLFRGRIVGVLACYLRTPPREDMFAWLPTFAAHAAVAIGNCRALQEIQRLHEQLELERDYLREEAAQVVHVDGIVGESKAITRLLRQVDLVAATEANVLIEGESGTGKELIARAIHQRSPRSTRSLVKVNCASIPADLFESEFFGHVRGAFTGAVRDRVGRFQLADRGTIFLDEVGEIPLDLQTKLLRVLQEGDFERVGEDATRHVNVRVLAATNRSLRAEVDAGRFRLDLFYRLGVFPIQVPPLRERRADIAALTTRFIRDASQRLHRPLPKMPQREMAKLLAYDWPGNIRELQHVVERAVILAPEGGAVQFDVDSSPAGHGDHREGDRAYRTETEWRRLERENLLAALKASGGTVAGHSGAAALLGMNPNTLTSRLRALGVKKMFVE
ncbi:MAG TPA: sigma 54-interacting transcriptional regulator [Vicinamibacterales bacterium]